MKIELALDLAGLCMFAPSPDGKVLHGLFPHTKHGHGGHDGADGSHMEEHVVILAYDRGHRPGAGGGLTNRYDLIQLPSNPRLSVGAGVGGSHALRVDKTKVVVLDESVRFPGVDRMCISPDAADRLVGRLELHSGAADPSGYQSDGSQWCIGSDNKPVRPPQPGCAKIQEFAEQARWIAGRFDSRQDERGNPVLALDDAITVGTLDGGTPAVVLPMLRPIQNRVTLRLWHVVKSLLPNQDGEFRDPASLPPSDHFAVYYTLAAPAAFSGTAKRLTFLNPSVLCAFSQAVFA